MAAKKQKLVASSSKKVVKRNSAKKTDLNESPKAGAQSFQLVRKRDGRVVQFDASRIVEAVFKAMEKTNEGSQKDATTVADKVTEALSKKFPSNYILGIEEIQDEVESSLMALNYAQTSKSYILYREERAKLREQRKEVPANVKKLVEDSKKYFRNPLSEFIYYRTYSRWLPTEGRRETWIETVDRYMGFMKENIGESLSDNDYNDLREAILRQEVMPSMRLLWGAGEAARKTNVSAYNCSFIAPSKIEDFAEIMYLSMCGTGVGFSVEQQTVQKLPQIKHQTGKRLPTHLIEDSKEGWARAATLGLKTWFNGMDIDFDYSALRPLGARLKTMGGKSSGPGPLREFLNFARKKILAKQGRRLNSLDVHDIICKIGEIVVMGGVRRSALISLSDLDDQEMRYAKHGQFYLNEPHRAMANNSVAYNGKPNCHEFLEEWLALSKNGTGERGIFNRGSLKDQLPARRWRVFQKHVATSGTNPCVTGDTLVYVADGRGNVPIKVLSDEGKDVPVFCLDTRGALTVRTLRNPRITGTKRPVYKILLDDGSVIRTTGNHKFRLRSGEYKEVNNLKYGDSLAVITRFEASIKDLFPTANSRSQNYWWINNGQRNNQAEHRLIASYHQNTSIPRGCIVHHRDRNAQNNNAENLEIMTKEAHDALHGLLMSGDANPMRRAHHEWGEDRWHRYKLKHSENNKGERNKNFSGFTHEELKEHALTLTNLLGRRFSNKDWAEYANEKSLPQYFSKWRQDHLGGIVGLAKWAASILGFDHINEDPRLTCSYQFYTDLGYDCEIVHGQLVVNKICEVCGDSFQTDINSREHGICGISCGLRRKWADPNFHAHTIRRIQRAHQEYREYLMNLQAKIYSDLKFQLGREPLKREWAKACKANNVSAEMCRKSSPFREYNGLKEFASSYNHKVISVSFSGYETVYNGTVDEFHNFFIGGFESQTKNGKRKFVYLNNLQCGEIVLRSKQFCNLSEVVARAEDTEETLMRKVRLATILGTYQSTLTNFPFLSKEWKKNCEEERLLGVSVTGQWDCPLVRNAEMLSKLRDEVVKVNKAYAKKLGINQSTAVTCVKPSGTVSQLVDAASGLHPRHSEYYIRRIRIAATDGLFKMLRDQKVPFYPEVGQAKDTAATYVLEFPVKAPNGAIFKNHLSAIDQMEHWRMVKQNYTEHNPSVTISVGPNEWIKVGNWLYENWDMIGGLSFLPREDHVYALAPYEEITEARYKELVANFPNIDFSQIVVYEKDDGTQGAKELACVSGVCEIV